ncbi:MAG TPA: ATP synthase F1 subunit delta [Thermomicrobiales bacterium]|nr:ATP synthase F1 subunit delta [Thermomicrobiales bacterium]
MAIRGVAKRYAQAVFDLANESGTHDQWLADLTTLAEVADDRVSREFFTGPNAADESKRRAIDQFLPRPEQELARNLAYMLIQRHRFDVLPDMVEVFRDMLLEARGIAIADVTTAVEMSAEERASVERQLSAMVGKQIELRARVDPELIGGIVARIGDQLIDGSVISRLRDMRAALAR